MKARSIIAGTLIGPGVFWLLTALSVTPGEVKRPAEVGNAWPGKGPERRTPGGVTVRGPCSPGTESWVDAVQRVATGQPFPGRVVYVLCGRDGRAYRTVLEYSHWLSQSRFVSWYPAAKFFAALSGPAAERIDLFDGEGRRTGHVILDRGRRHADFYDEAARWTGSGAADLSSGAVQRVDADGRRHEWAVLPILPEDQEWTSGRTAARMSGDDPRLVARAGGERSEARVSMASRARASGLRGTGASGAGGVPERSSAGGPRRRG